jgi:ribosomal protein L37AE/L43A
MSKKTGVEFADANLQEVKKPYAGKLSDEELDTVGAGRGDTLCCPGCGSDDIVWNNEICFWICEKCKNVWT